MQNLKRLVLLLALAAAVQAQGMMSYSATGNKFPVWQKITVANSGSNFTVTCVPTTTNCGTATVAKAGATAQSVVLYALPANGYIASCPQIKSTTAFTGTFVTLTGTLGTTQSGTFYTSSLYDLMGAVSATNFAPATGLCVGLGSTTRSATNLTLNLISTVANISGATAGVVEIQFLVSVMP